MIDHMPGTYVCAYSETGSPSPPEPSKSELMPGMCLCVYVCYLYYVSVTYSSN